MKVLNIIAQGEELLSSETLNVIGGVDGNNTNNAQNSCSCHGNNNTNNANLDCSCSDD